MSFGLNDCILAISTPSGKSFRAIIRLSGKDVFSYLRGIFAPGDIGRLHARKALTPIIATFILKRSRLIFLLLFIL